MNKQPTKHPIYERKKSKNYALLIILLLIVAIFFVVGMVKIAAKFNGEQQISLLQDCSSICCKAERARQPA